MYCNELKEFAQEQEQKLISALADTREHPSPDGETRSRIIINGITRVFCIHHHFAGCRERCNFLKLILKNSTETD